MYFLPFFLYRKKNLLFSSQNFLSFTYTQLSASTMYEIKTKCRQLTTFSCSTFTALKLVHKKQLSQMFSCSCHVAFMERSQCFLGDCCLPTIQWKREKSQISFFWKIKNKVERFHVPRYIYLTYA